MHMKIGNKIVGKSSAIRITLDIIEEVGCIKRQDLAENFLRSKTT